MLHYGEQAGLPKKKRHFHILKHSIATHLLDANHRPDVCKRLAGPCQHPKHAGILSTHEPPARRVDLEDSRQSANCLRGPAVPPAAALSLCHEVLPLCLLTPPPPRRGASFSRGNLACCPLLISNNSIGRNACASINRGHARCDGPSSRLIRRRKGPSTLGTFSAACVVERVGRGCFRNPIEVS